MSQHFQSCDYNTKDEENCIDDIYPKVAKISIDNGILEKAKNVYVIPADIGWSDLGTWTSVYENAVKDEEKNASKSRHILTYNAKGNIINLKNKNKAVIIDGLKNYIVVDTDKALLICPRANDQLIKEYVQDLKTLKKGDSFL
jgi:mannose-1-phosphate guanylyltransferase